MPNLQQHLLVSLILLLATLQLTACTTISRGSNTYFVVDTLPHGAAVTTDEIKTRSETEKYENSKFYGCPSTPCKIKMPRRSQFNLMITKSGYQPYFYVVQTKHYKESDKDKAIRLSVKLTSNGEILDEDMISSNAGIISENGDEAVVTAAGMVASGYLVGASVDATIAIASLPASFGSAAAAPIAVLLAEPVILLNIGVDLASGSLLDLTPNPMVIKLAPSINENDDVNQEQKFNKSRKIQ